MNLIRKIDKKRFWKIQDIFSRFFSSATFQCCKTPCKTLEFLEIRLFCFLLIVSFFICIAEISIAHPLAYQLTDNLISPTNIDMNLLLDQAMNHQKKSANGKLLVTEKLCWWHYISNLNGILPTVLLSIRNHHSCHQH